ncbi:hypothetical protein [Bordetella genomosp. 9]|uniref:hypothetical protein n=1 Tax=Bordetella genomosp. 9 TaxID=1416803 RepID=UPI0012F8EA11|nr:hypothetical protein [Bordetella genomosp. 9]
MQVGKTQDQNLPYLTVMTPLPGGNGVPSAIRHAFSQSNENLPEQRAGRGRHRRPLSLRSGAGVSAGVSAGISAGISPATRHVGGAQRAAGHESHSAAEFSTTPRSAPVSSGSAIGYILPVVPDAGLPSFPLLPVFPEDLSATSSPDAAPSAAASSGWKALARIQQALTSIAQRVRAWAAPSESQRALRGERLREKVTNAAYVFLNAMHSGEPLDKYFAKLRRQVRRLDKHARQSQGLSFESARILSEVARRVARIREGAVEKILSFHREALLFDVSDSDDFRHADRVLLALECHMSPAISVYGHPMRRIASLDVNGPGAPSELREALEQLLFNENQASLRSQDGWEREGPLGTAVVRLPYRTLVRLDAVLSQDPPLRAAGPANGSGTRAYDDLLDDIALAVRRRLSLA